MTPVSQLRGPSREHLARPFFDSRPSKYAAALDAFAAETAQAVIDRAVQMLDGRGVRSGEWIEQLYGSGWYARSTDLFQIDRPSWAAWQEKDAKAKPA